MRGRLAILTTVALMGCSSDTHSPAPMPSARPAPPSSGEALVWGLVVDESGVCVAGATARVVRGQRLGEVVSQETPCDAWDYSGGFMFRNVAPGVEMTIRASAPGYVDEERSITPSSGLQTSYLFPMSRRP